MRLASRGLARLVWLENIGEPLIVSLSLRSLVHLIDLVLGVVEAACSASLPVRFGMTELLAVLVNHVL